MRALSQGSGTGVFILRLKTSHRGFRYGVNFWKYYSGNNVEKAPTWDREITKRVLE